MVACNFLAGCALVALACCAAASASPIVLVDSKDGAYLHPGASAQLDKSNLAALMSAATGLLPGQDIDASLSHQLEAVLKPSALKKPRAYVVLNVAGLSADSMNQLFQNRQHRTVELTGKGCPVGSVVDALTRVSAANPGLRLTVIDQAGLQNCKGNCVQQNLAAAGSVCKTKVTAASNGPLLGSLTFENGASIDLKGAEDKLFGAELSSVFAGVKNELVALMKRSDLKVQQEDVEVYEVTFMGLHSLADKYGKDSTIVEAARTAVVQLLKWAIDGMDEVYNGDVVYQVALLNSAPENAERVSSLMAWKDRTRRQLLSTTGYPEADEVQQAKMFTAKACGYGTLLLLVYFSFAAVWCMCFMPFKQDTLLYGSKKDQ